MLSAPVSGSVPAVENGTLTIMVGGPVGAFERAEAVLRDLGSTVTHVGEVEQALALKLAINISLAVQMLAFSEGLLLAERGGVDTAVALDVMTRSAIGSPMLGARAPMMHNLPERAWFDVSMMYKDLRLALDSGLSAGLSMPSTVAAHGMLDTARAYGHGHRDIAVLYRTLRELATP
jgi:3-hydroxyisobutyrate dehydrogenase-like beta-hydroxyacid dehydrogenase